MDCAKKLAHLLEGCGAKYTRIDAKEGTLFTVSTGDGQYFVLVRDDDAGIEMWSRYFTPEQAIVATVGRGNLTAEQVREAIMSADRWRKPMGDTGMTNTHLIIRDDGWQAIADKLNATLGAGTCHIEVHDNLAETEGMGDVWLECDECHWQMPLEPTTPRFKYCPNCRREVVRK